MSQFRHPLFLAVGTAVALSVSAVASGPTFWTMAAAADFLKGTSDGVYVSLSGLVTAGPRLTNRLATTPSQIWSLAEGGGTLWAGTGGDGRVIRLRPGQFEETVFDSNETNVFALAVSGTRTYAATSPDGRVYLIEGTTPARPFFDPEEKYIWALAVDAQGRLWVGAGNPAVIYRVDANGTSRVVYHPPAAHVVALVNESNGRMLAGTESPGRLYRFDANDKPFVVLETGASELRAISVNPAGVIFAASVAKGDEAAGETSSVAATLASAPAAAGASPATAATSRKSVLYRIETSGTWESVWNTNDLIYDLSAAADGGVLVATGPEGRLYRVDRNLDVSLFSGVDAHQITRFTPSDRGTAPAAFATANPGRVVQLGSGDQAAAAYISPVRDSKSVATWGLVRWDATGPLTLATRSGNTERPDDSWSDWSPAYTKADGQAITSPAARFLQWKAMFSQATPAATPSQLSAVTVAYLARNSRPVVTSVTVHPPGVVFQRPYANDDSAIAGLDEASTDARRVPGADAPPSPPPGRRMFQKGLQTLAWKAEDDDGDRLTYLLEYRREGEATWRDLKAGISDGIYVWDTTAVADGRYIVRVRASDSPSNATDRTLAGDRESDPISVDNTPPVVTTELLRQGGSVRVVVRVHDARSPIQKVEYSAAGGPWQLVYPADGLADSPDERYEIPVASEADAGRLVIRATDTLQNVVSQPVAAR